MAKLNFNTPLLDITGADSNVILKDVLSNQLLQANTKEPVKYFDWALKLHQDGDLDLDNTDQEKLKDFIKSCETLNVLGKGRLLEVFN